MRRQEINMSNAIHMDNSTITKSDVWYRQFYVWLIIFLPACAVVASFATLYVAAKNPPELVVENYSSIEATNARNVSQDNEATRLALSAELNFGRTAASGTEVELRLQANDTQALPSRIVLRVVHGTQAAQDAMVELAGMAGNYAGLIKLPSGNYDIFIEDTQGTWRLTKRVAGQPATINIHAPDVAALKPVQD